MKEKDKLPKAQSAEKAHNKKFKIGIVLLIILVILFFIWALYWDHRVSYYSINPSFFEDKIKQYQMYIAMGGGIISLIAIVIGRWMSK